MEPHNAFCLQCANIFPLSEAEATTCPNCGWSMLTADFKELYAEAARVYRFGHQYRDFYESEYKAHKAIRRKACLAPVHEIWNFIAIAALSGVIGDAAYATISKVYQQLKKCLPRKERDQKKEAHKNEELQILIRHSRNYLDGMPNINVKVRAALEEEINVDIATKECVRTLESCKWESEAEVQTAVEEGLREALRKIKDTKTSRMTRARMQQLLSDVWNELPGEPQE